MATTENTYTGSTSTGPYSFTFPYIKEADVKVSKNGVALTLTTDYTQATTSITLTGAPLTTDNIRIYRVTDDSGLTATFYPGSAIRSVDLNDNFTQNLYSTQEVVSRYLDSGGSTFTGTIEAQAGVTGDLLGDVIGDVTGDVTGNVTGGVTGDVTGNADTATDLAAATKITNSEQSGHTVNDSTYFTTSAADARYFNISSGETIKDGDTFPDNDTTIATTAAINDRIIDLVEDVGGFVAIADETEFPDANPDVNNGTGTIVSVKTIATSFTSNGSGVATIANGNVSDDETITINGLENSTTYGSGSGMLLETTAVEHTYTFHRLTPNATEVTTVASKATEIGRLGTTAVVEDLGILGTTAAVADMDILADISSNITTVAGIDSNVTTVAGIAANVTAVAGVSSEVTTTAGKATEIGRLGVTAVVEDMGILGTTACVADMAVIADTTDLISDLSDVADVATEIGRLGTAAAVEDLGILGTTAIVSDLDTLADIASNITTVAGVSSNVTTVAGISSNVTTVAGNNANVTAVGGKATEIGRLGTADAVADMNTLGTAAIVEDMNLLGTSAVVADMALLGDSAVIADMATIADTSGLISDLSDVADIAANVTAVAGVSSNVTTVANNLTNVNDFADKYQIAASAPTTRADSSTLEEGDLWFDTANDALKIWQTSSWEAGVTDLSGVVTDAELASWVGTSNITTAGTIGTGTWQGTAVADGYIASAGTWNAKQSALTFGIANNNAVKIDDADAADNDYAKFTTTGIEGRSSAEVKTDLSLDNVENTALSTWAGTTNITTLGTVATGTWNGTAIADSYIASGIANNNVLKVDDADAADDDYAKFTSTGIEGRSAAEVKTDLSLNNVENTAVSTWAGTSNITTLGTVGTGTWQGTAIAGTYIADDTITEAKLDVSNAPTDDYVLTADSGEGGGLKWAEAAGGGGGVDLELPAAGYYNICIGEDAGSSLATTHITGYARRNIFIGDDAGKDTAVNPDTVAIGYNAYGGAGANYIGANVAIGNDVMSGDTSGNIQYGVAIGYQAMKDATNGTQSVGIGLWALKSNTGGHNVAIGGLAMYNNSSGSDNTAVGKSALRGNTDGVENIGIGYLAGYGNSTGDFNTYMGAWSGYAASTADHNTGVGYKALDSISSGAYNTSLGSGSGDTITTGDYNTCLGYNAEPSAGGVDGEIVIGNGLTGKGTLTAFIGGTNGAYNGKNVTTWETTSDRRIKKDIVDNNVGLSVIEQLQVRNFEYKTEDEIKTDNPELTDVVASAVIDVEGVQIGLIAQELEEVCPGCVSTNSTGIKSVSTDELFWHMLNAIKELSAQVKELQKT